MEIALRVWGEGKGNGKISLDSDDVPPLRSCVSWWWEFDGGIG